jgi:hypothetical protein
MCEAGYTALSSQISFMPRTAWSLEPFLKRPRTTFQNLPIDYYLGMYNGRHERLFLGYVQWGDVSLFLEMPHQIFAFP